jgi:hypothetical protein
MWCWVVGVGAGCIDGNEPWGLVNVQQDSCCNSTCSYSSQQRGLQGSRAHYTQSTLQHNKYNLTNTYTTYNKQLLYKQYPSRHVHTPCAHPPANPSPASLS